MKSLKMLVKKILLSLTSISFLLLGIWVVGVENILTEFSQLPVWAVLSVLVVLLLNLAAVSYRLKKLLKYFGYELHYSVAAKASVQGHFAALFFISLFGQVVGRQLVLKQHGMPSVLVAMLTAMEKAVLLVVSSVVGFLGATWLIERAEIAEFFGKTSFIQLTLVIFLCTIASLVAGSSKFEASLVAKIFTKTSFTRFIRLIGITALAQSTVLSSFVIVGYALVPNIAIIDLLAAAALTSFAASLPISVNGWGIREITAVFAFGAIGVPDSVALATSVIVGLASTVVILIAYPFSLMQKKNKDSTSIKVTTSADTMYLKPSPATLPVEKTASWAIIIGLSVLVFFQIHVPLAGGVININLADAFALISLAAVIAYVVEKQCLPKWQIIRFNLSLAIITLVLLLGFLNGVIAIGVTQWALVSRVVGWIVLLGYLSVGMMAVTFMSQYGLRRLTETLIITAVVIIMFQIIIRSLALYGLVDSSLIPINFEGYSGNRNAFVFQIICCIVLIMTYSERYVRTPIMLSHSNSFFIRTRSKTYTIFLGVLLCGVVLTGSRAGMITTAGLLMFVFLLQWTNRKMLLEGTSVALLLWFFSVFFLPTFLPWAIKIVVLAIEQVFLFAELPTKHLDCLLNSLDLLNNKIVVQSSLSNATSDSERWATLLHGYELWKESPWLGIGLGVFIEKSTQWFGHDIVIHSTPVWILTELGLLGLFAFIIAIGLVAYSLWAEGLRTDRNKGVFLLVSVFLVFSLVHEIFAQRVFWLTLGVLIGLPISNLSKKKDEKNEYTKKYN